MHGFVWLAITDEGAAHMSVIVPVCMINMLKNQLAGSEENAEECILRTSVPI